MKVIEYVPVEHELDIVNERVDKVIQVGPDDIAYEKV